MYAEQLLIMCHMEHKTTFDLTGMMFVSVYAGQGVSPARAQMLAPVVAAFCYERDVEVTKNAVAKQYGDDYTILIEKRVPFHGLLDTQSSGTLN